MNNKALFGTAPDPAWVEEQIAQTENLLRTHPNNPWLLVQLGNLLTISQSPKHANDETTDAIINTFVRATECDPKYVDAYAELAHFYSANVFDSRAAIYWASRCLSVIAEINQRMTAIIEQEFGNLFQSSSWKSSPDKRCWMITDLLETIPLESIPTASVESLLGKADIITTAQCAHASQKALVYLIPADTGAVNERLVVRISESDRVCCFERVTED